MVVIARQNPILSIGAVGMVALALTAVGADVISPYDPLTIDASRRLEPPSRDFLLGTDRFGRDILSRLIHGTRISLGIAFTAITSAAIIAVLLGLVSGFYGRYLDQLIMRAMDLLFGFPPLLLALTIAAAFGPSTGNAALAIALIYIPVFARIVRASVLVESQREYVDALRVMGARDRRALFRHILPNVVTPLIVQFCLALAAAVLLESGLSYLGLGTQPPAASWGTLLNEGRVFLVRAPWISIFPGTLIAASVLIFFLVGDGLRDRLDPRYR